MDEMKQFVVIKVREEEYAVRIAQVQSIEKVPAITLVPQLPAYLTGICTIREEIIPVVDMQHLLYNETTENKALGQLILISHGKMTIGLLVSSAKEILSIREEQMKQVGLAGYPKTSYMNGVIQLEDRLITALDTSSWLTHLEGMKEILHYMEDYQQESVQ